MAPGGGSPGQSRRYEAAKGRLNQTATLYPLAAKGLNHANHYDR